MRHLAIIVALFSVLLFTQAASKPKFDPTVVNHVVGHLAGEGPSDGYYYVEYSGPWRADNPLLSVTFGIYENRPFHGLQYFEQTVTLYYQYTSLGNSVYSVDIPNNIPIGSIESSDVISSVIE